MASLPKAGFCQYKFYVLFGGGNGKQDILRWLASSCTVVPEFSRENERTGQVQPGAGLPMALYRCG